jgi:5-methyltetrahydrofolate--homocysteine methyltransferase
MKYKHSWDDAKRMWDGYWKRENAGRPIMNVIARKSDDERVMALPEELAVRDINDCYFDAARKVARYRHFCETHEFLAESFPNLSGDFGPGSLAGYLGCELNFTYDTVWFEPCVSDWSAHPPIEYREDNKWWKAHLKLISDIRGLAGGDFYVNIPDIVENVDILAAMRGPQDFIYDMMDNPEEIEKRVAELDAVYFEYYDRMHAINYSQSDSGSSYTAFNIWGRGRTAKLQCDFNAMMSPALFRRFVVPSLIVQASRLDNVIFHLDGPECICHVDALMEIEGINALQWTSGAAHPDGTDERWFPIYDKVIKAGKGLWLAVYDGDCDDRIRRLDKLIARYGSRGIYLNFDVMSMADAEKLLAHAERHWS